MNILIDIEKILQDDKYQSKLISINLTIINNKKISNFKGIFENKNIIFETNVNFVENNKYIFIISIVVLGKQIFKEKYNFIYKCKNSYLTKDKNITFKLVNDRIQNKVKSIEDINITTFKSYNFKINPLAIIRKESENCKTIFLNDNIYILKGNLAKIFDKISNNKEYKSEIIKFNEFNNIKLLVKKGCIICYEQ